MNSRWLYYQIHGVMPPRHPRRRRSGGGPARNWKYKSWIRSLPCAACGSTHSVEAAHTGNDGGMAQKASDSSVVPLCALCHRLGSGAYHTIGKPEFERRNAIDFADLVRELNLIWRNREWLRAA